MGAITSAVIAIAGVVLGWITIEIACKPCLDKGREAIDHSLNPDYDPDENVTISNNLRTPLNPNPNPDQDDLAQDAKAFIGSSNSSDAIKAV